MFFGTVDNPKNANLRIQHSRVGLHGAVMILSLWMAFIQTILAYLEKPVNALVKQVKPDYPILAWRRRHRRTSGEIRNIAIAIVDCRLKRLSKARQQNTKHKAQNKVQT